MTEHLQPQSPTAVHDGEDKQEAVPLGKGIFMSCDVSNVFRVVTRAGDVIINTGVSRNGQENFRRLSAVSSNPIRKIILTQGHAHQIGGWSMFNRNGAVSRPTVSTTRCSHPGLVRRQR